jgi:hypothetical protein
MGGKYVLPFCFKNDSGTRTSHYLIFVSKHILGYGIMKEIMGGESSSSEQNVPSFSYCLADKKMPLLFELSRPLDDLEGMLLVDFAGRTLRMKEIFDNHHVGRPYLKRNYKDVLLQLEARGKVVVDPPANMRHANTFGDAVTVKFHPKMRRK